MRDAYIVAVASTNFGRHLDRSHSDLVSSVVEELAADAKLEDLTLAEQIWFGSSFLDAWGQPNVRGQAVLAPLIESGKLASRVPIVNVEAACATSASALHGAVTSVRAGESEVAIALGVEKMHLGERAPAGTILNLLAGCAERLDKGRLESMYAAASADVGRTWGANPDVSMFMETYAVQACLHMARYGVGVEALATICAKTHNYAAENPLAQYQFTLTPEQVLQDRMVATPFTRSMCAPISDGATGVMVCSAEWLARQDPDIRRRAVRVAGIGIASGSYTRNSSEPTLSRYAGRRAFAQASLRPDQVDLVEVHDATSYAEILQLEMLELCPEGAAAKLALDGETGPGGSLPVNTSGGLVAKGHPVGATGLSMIYELTKQLRHEAGSRQVPDARVGLAENGGGVLGLEEATCFVTLLEGTR